MKRLRFVFLAESGFAKVKSFADKARVVGFFECNTNGKSNSYHALCVSGNDGFPNFDYAIATMIFFLTDNRR